MTRGRKRPEEGPPRKERVLHTRVPAALDEALRQFAESMRVPVSNLVRVLLEDAIKVTRHASDRVVEAATEVAQAAIRPPGARRKSREDLPEVFGYQPLTLAIDCTCLMCGRDLVAGEDAFLALRDPPGARVFVCARCVPRPTKKEKMP